MCEIQRLLSFSDLYILNLKMRMVIPISPTSKIKAVSLHKDYNL